MMFESSRLVKFLALCWLAFVSFPSFSDDYRVYPEDVISIGVFGEPELSVEDARVSTNGTISVPLIGNIQVAGKSTDEITLQVRNLLADGYLKNPKVTVTIQEYRQVFVNGAVNAPGGYSYQEGLTVQKAIVLAGGMNERGSSSKITLIKENQPDREIRVNLKSLVSPGDIITVGESFF